jgi:hypothetical protein
MKTNGLLFEKMLCNPKIGCFFEKLPPEVTHTQKIVFFFLKVTAADHFTEKLSFLKKMA